MVFSRLLRAKNATALMLTLSCVRASVSRALRRLDCLGELFSQSGVQMVSEEGELQLLFKGELRPLLDGFDLDHALRMLDQQSGWKGNTGTLGLKALIDLHMKYPHHHLPLLDERPVPH